MRWHGLPTLSPAFSTTNPGQVSFKFAAPHRTGGRAELQLHATKATNRITDQYCGDIALAGDSPVTFPVVSSVTC